MPRPTRDEPTASLRIIGGTYRGRPLLYSGDPRTRPMKDRVRENLFNLLTGEVPGKHAIDLFAGTGALGLEAISRGAERATLIERHIPTAKIIRQNIERLGMDDAAQVVMLDALTWGKQLERGSLKFPEDGDKTMPWLVFVSPPWSLFESRLADMLALINTLVRCSPPGSVVAVEADEAFDLTQLPDSAAWDIRPYLPAVLAIWRSQSQ